MPATYEPIATTTLGSAASSITFSSIPATYTDLRIVLTCTSSSVNNAFYRLNNDTASNYSWTEIYGLGSSAGSSRGVNADRQYLNQQGNTSTTIPEFFTVDIFSYSNTSTFKTSLITGQQDLNGSGAVEYQTSLYRSTLAISRLDFGLASGTFSIGTTATLYGIKNA